MKTILKELNNFISLWVVGAISSLGSAMTSFALVVWAYKHYGTASSIALIAMYASLPSIAFCFIAGTFADHFNKKTLLIVDNGICAIGSLTILILYYGGHFQIWQLYLINAFLSFVNAFSDPAYNVVTTLITPSKYYVKVSGLQTLSSSIVKIISPIIATFVIVYLNMEAIFIFDSVTFIIVIIALLFIVKIPIQNKIQSVKPCFRENFTEGLNFIFKNKPLFKIILYMGAINFFDSFAGEALMPAMVISKTNTFVLSAVTSSIGIGSVVGSILVTVLKPPKNHTKVVFWSCLLSYLLCNIPWAIGHSAVVLVIGSILGYITVPFITANMTVIMRTKVPIEMQGRVFSARNTLQYISKPIGLWLGGFFADHFFTPFMSKSSSMQYIFSYLVGSGKASGISLMFLLTGTAGAIISFISLRSDNYKELDE